MNIEPQIISEKGFTLLGCVFYGDPFHSAKAFSVENEIGLLWGRFMKYMKKYSFFLEKIIINPNISYEIHFESDEYKKTKKYTIFVGIEVNSLEEIPLGMFSTILPKTKYAYYTTKAIEDDAIEDLFNIWLPNSQYEQIYPYIIECYDAKRFLGLENNKSEIDWYIPIEEI
ncbi:MAG: GyrI-like domain-containing protein, partial [archaeon]|nr:GyrI-like domain-containing protein [archaeon]